MIQNKLNIVITSFLSIRFLLTLENQYTSVVNPWKLICNIWFVVNEGMMWKEDQVFSEKDDERYYVEEEKKGRGWGERYRETEKQTVCRARECEWRHESGGGGGGWRHYKKNKCYVLVNLLIKLLTDGFGMKPTNSWLPHKNSNLSR
jgi:hypothetical protein